jgi:hypothetical protein
MWTMPERAPLARSSGKVVYAGCGKRALVTLDAISRTYEEDRKVSRDTARTLQPAGEALFQEAETAVVDQRCPVPIPEIVASQWERVTRWRDVDLWIRKTGEADRPAQGSRSP